MYILGIVIYAIVLLYNNGILNYYLFQSFVFRVQAHPKDPHYTQCVSFGFFTSRTTEVAYNLLCVMFMYFIPLFVIISAYTAIMCEISKNSKETKGKSI